MFLSGVGSVTGGIWVIRSVRKRAERSCDLRIQQLRAEYDRGLDRGMHLEERHDETSA